MNTQTPRALRQGVKLLHDPVRNKGTAYTEAERDIRSCGDCSRRASTPRRSKSCACSAISAKSRPTSSATST